METNDGILREPKNQESGAAIPVWRVDQWQGWVTRTDGTEVVYLVGEVWTISIHIVSVGLRICLHNIFVGFKYKECN